MELKDALLQVQVTSLICSTFAIGSTVYRFCLQEQGFGLLFVFYVDTSHPGCRRFAAVSLQQWSCSLLRYNDNILCHRMVFPTRIFDPFFCNFPLILIIIRFLRIIICSTLVTL